MWAVLAVLNGSGASGRPADPPCVEVEGRPFFVIGCYDYPGGDDFGFEHLKEMADSGINTVHWALRCFPEAYPNQPRDFTLEDLNNAHRLGLKVVAALNSVPPWTEEDIVLAYPRCTSLDVASMHFTPPQILTRASYPLIDTLPAKEITTSGDD